MRLPRFLTASADDEHYDCRCGHASRAHEHYRRGSDCALCTCPKFRAGAVAARPEEPRSAHRERVRAA